MSITAEPHEEDPLISPAAAPLKESYTSVYVFLCLLFLGSLGYWIAAEAVVDAQYYVICQHKGLGLEHCFQEPLANDLEGVLSSYITSVIGTWGIVVVLLLARGLNKYGMRGMSLTFLTLGLLGSISFGALLQSPGAHYMWNLGPAILFGSGFQGISQFLGSIYIAETVQDVNMRTTFLGWSSASDSLVQVVGPLLGGFILRQWGISAQFAASALASSAAIVAVYFCMSEVSHVKREEEPDIIESFKLAAGLRAQDPVRKRAMQKSNGFLVVITVILVTFSKLSNIYVKSRFGWSASENGYLVSVSSAIKFACSAVVTPAVLVFLSKYFTRHSADVDFVDKTLSYWYVGVTAISFIIAAAYPGPSVFFCATVFQALSQIAQAPLVTMCVKFAPENAITSYWTGISYFVMFATLPSVTLSLRLYRQVLRLLPESFLWACTIGLLGCFVMVKTIKAKE